VKVLKWWKIIMVTDAHLAKAMFVLSNLKIPQQRLCSNLSPWVLFNRMHWSAAVDMSKKELLIVVYYNAVITWLIQYTSQMTCHEIITKVRLQICGPPASRSQLFLLCSIAPSCHMLWDVNYWAPHIH